MRPLAILFVLFLTIVPAYAGFSVCNRTAQTTITALGRFDGTTWTSQGWWHITPGSCMKLINGALNARYYYLYATDGTFNTWDGHANFCVGIFEKFTISGRGHCAARGLDERGFLEVDTGDRLNWTQMLSSPR